MRISTNTLYQNGIARISELQGEQAKLQQQISASKRILTPSDDPVAAARALELKEALSSNSQYASNRIIAKNQLSATEATLSNVSDLLLAAQSTLASAGNPTYSDEQRGYLATELRGMRDELMGLANTRDGSGNYLFSGFRSATAPYVASATGADYQGDGGVQHMQVAAGRQMAVNEPGSEVFQADGTDIFQAFNDIITLLETPVTDQAGRDALSAGLATGNTDLASALDNVLTARARAGSKLNELDALDAAGLDLELQFKQTLSSLEDLDYAQAISDISKKQVILDAAQQTFIKTVGLSLFNLLK